MPIQKSISCFLGFVCSYVRLITTGNKNILCCSNKKSIYQKVPPFFSAALPPTISHKSFAARSKRGKNNNRNLNAPRSHLGSRPERSRNHKRDAILSCAPGQSKNLFYMRKGGAFFLKYCDPKRSEEAGDLRKHFFWMGDGGGLVHWIGGGSYKKKRREWVSSLE